MDRNAYEIRPKTFSFTFQLENTPILIMLAIWNTITICSGISEPRPRVVSQYFVEYQGTLSAIISGINTAGNGGQNLELTQIRPSICNLHCLLGPCSWFVCKNKCFCRLCLIANIRIFLVCYKMVSTVLNTWKYVRTFDLLLKNIVFSWMHRIR